jgi:hypothetical protein
MDISSLFDKPKFIIRYKLIVLPMYQKDSKIATHAGGLLYESNKLQFYQYFPAKHRTTTHTPANLLYGAFSPRLTE